MKNHKRKSIYSLWEALGNKLPDGEPARKEKLFNQIFGETWTANKDYLLRNELRLFTEVLQDFLLQKTLKRRLKEEKGFKDYWLGETFKERGLDHLHQLQIGKLKRQTKPGGQHFTQGSVLDWEIDRLFQQSEVTIETYTQIRELCQQRIRQMEQDFVLQLRRIEEKRALAERVMAIISPDYSFSSLQTQLDLQKPALNQAESLYLYHRSLSFALKGLAQVKERREALRYLHLAELPQAQKHYKIMIEMAGIALQYSFLQDSQAAAGWYGKLEDFSSKNGVKIPGEVLFNLFSFRVKKGEYEQAILIHEHNESNIPDNEKLKYRFLCVKGMCHNFLGEARAALACIDPGIQQRPSQENFYFRYIEMIAFYLIDLAEDALREARNLLKVVVYQHKEEYDVPYADISRLFILFFKNVQETKSKQKTLMQDLAKKLEKVRAAIHHLHRDYLPLQWLAGQLDM